MATLDQKVKASIFNVIALSNLNSGSTANGGTGNIGSNVNDTNKMNMSSEVSSNTLEKATVSENNNKINTNTLNTNPPPLPQFNGFPSMSSLKTQTGAVVPLATSTNKHPFLKSTVEPPNSGSTVTSIKDLIPKKIDYNQMLVNSGIIKAAVPSVAIDINVYIEQMKK